MAVLYADRGFRLVAMRFWRREPRQHPGNSMLCIQSVISKFCSFSMLYNAAAQQAELAGIHQVDFWHIGTVFMLGNGGEAIGLKARII